MNKVRIISNQNYLLVAWLLHKVKQTNKQTMLVITSYLKNNASNDGK